jgi:hypothetical protein
MAGTTWSQPNQQVVRDGDPVGIPNTDGDPDPQAGGEAKRAAPHRGRRSRAHESGGRSEPGGEGGGGEGGAGGSAD